MAINSFARSDSNSVQYWSRRLEVETNKALAISPLMGTDDNSIIMIQQELTKDMGDKSVFNLRMQLTGDGFTENEAMEGSEESFTFYQDSLVVNELYNGVRFPGKVNINQQRVPFKFNDFAKSALRDWFAKRYTKSFFNQVCGYTAETRAKYSGNNTITAPSSGRILRPGGATTDEGMTTDAYKFDIRMIDYAKEAARIASPMMRPTMVDGKECYVMYLDPRQVVDLRTSTSTGQWLDITKAYENGFGKDSSIVKGSIGMYNGVILREAPDDVIPYGVNSSTAAAETSVRRAVLLGAQAAVAAWSQNGGPTNYSWETVPFDYGRQMGVGAGTIYGIKKSIYNSKDYGTVVVSTYAAAHTTTS
jgi:N4-gp56 family major capsid protein